MSFQFDDEHGTERPIAAQTVNYGRTLESNGNEQLGRISRWWLEYDEDGHVTSLKYADQNSTAQWAMPTTSTAVSTPTTTKDERPPSPISDATASRPQRAGDFQRRNSPHDDNDNWVKAVYLTVDGQPALDVADGLSGV